MENYCNTRKEGFLFSRCAANNLLQFQFSLFWTDIPSLLWKIQEISLALKFLCWKCPFRVTTTIHLQQWAVPHKQECHFHCQGLVERILWTPKLSFYYPVLPLLAVNVLSTYKSYLTEINGSQQDLLSLVMPLVCLLFFED